MLVDPEDDRPGGGIERQLEVRVAQAAGERLDVDDAAPRKRVARWSVGSSGGCRGDRPRRARAAGCRRWQAASVCWLYTCGHGKWRRAAGRSRPDARPTSGCSASTITSCMCTAWSSAALLAECAGTPTPDWSRLTVPTIAAFVQTQANRLGPSTRRSPVTATRAFLRFLATRGVIPAGIDGAVPTIRQWKHAALPRAVAAEDVQRVLAAVDVTRLSGLRDRAILLLLIRLGLRAGEVAALAVNDVDWHNGTVRVAGKGGRERRLPLPADIGEALVAALRSRPPTSPPDVIFATARPPYRQLNGGNVTDVAQRALRRAGVTVPRPGAHVFRHTFASQMVRRDVPMKTIADLLGHARLRTTTIYAKLDREALAAIALPWPGGAR